MDASDPRHGTYAGASRHWKDGEEPCPPCAQAASRVRKRNQYLEEIGHPQTIDKLGTVRRIRALQTLGWTLTQIAHAAHLHPKTIKNPLYRGNTCYRTTADAIERAYGKLSMKFPPEATALERRNASYARNIARRHKWAPPMAWDDIDNDPEPTGVFKGTSRDIQGPSRDSVDHARIERLLGGDWTLAAVATRGEREVVRARWTGTLNDLERLTGWRVDRYQLTDGAA